MNEATMRMCDDVSGLDRLVSAENVRRYRKLPGARTDAGERRVIMRQPAEEAARLRNH